MPTKSKTELILEHAAGRYQLGGFLQGDVIKFGKNWEKKQSFIDLADPLQNYLTHIAASEVVLYVEKVINSMPLSDHSSQSIEDNPEVVLDIGIEIGSGRIIERFRAPGNLFDVMSVDECAENKSLYNFDRFKYDDSRDSERAGGVHINDYMAEKHSTATSAEEFLDSFKD